MPETYYKELLDIDAAAYPNATYEYAICLRANGKYNLAQQQQLEKFLKKQNQQLILKQKQRRNWPIAPLFNSNYSRAQAM